MLLSVTNILQFGDVECYKYARVVLNVTIIRCGKGRRACVMKLVQTGKPRPGAGAGICRKCYTNTQWEGTLKKCNKNKLHKRTTAYKKQRALTVTAWGSCESGASGAGPSNVAMAAKGLEPLGADPYMRRVLLMCDTLKVESHTFACHMSHVTRHTSHVTRHTSHVTRTEDRAC